MLGDDVRVYGYDRSSLQLAFFNELFPEVFTQIVTGVMDLTEASIAADIMPAVVFASTVLMNIQRPEAYRNALQNLLASAREFVVLMDNWSRHDYFADLAACLRESDARSQRKLYVYDSGANIAIVVAFGEEALGPSYERLRDGVILGKYLGAR